MQIKIYYCVVWNYEPSAVSLAAELKESFEVEAELHSGERGDFEVVVDGKKIFSKKKNYEEVELKEFSILYLIINNLNVFEKKIELLSELKLYTKICIEFLNKIIDLLILNKTYETNTLKEKFKQTKYFNLINDINAFAPVKFIAKIKKDNDEMLLIFEEINNDLKKFELNQKIDNLEKKMIQNMNEETYKELLDLKRQANNG